MLNFLVNVLLVFFAGIFLSSLHPLLVLVSRHHALFIYIHKFIFH